MQSAPPNDPAVAADSAATPGAGVAAASSFEAALAELEAIVARMESGELPLEEALAGYRRGAQLLQFCQSALKDAQQQVQILEAGLLQDFADADRGE
jgi:exodeoxyribonuclease VII small subunit